MMAKILVFVFAAVALVAGSSCEFKFPQESTPQFISLPIQPECCYTAPVVSDVFSSGCSNLFSESSSTSSSSSSSSSSSQVVSTPVVTENLFSTANCPSVFASLVPTQVVSDNIFSSGSSGNSLAEIFSRSSSGVETNNGPESSPITVIQAPSVTLPPVEGPVVTLASQPIPPPKVLSQRCICTKTIVKPQIIQREVTVPKIQRYLKRTVTPVVENVCYKSAPVDQSSSGSDIVVPGSGSSCSPVVLSGSQSRCVVSPVVVSSGPSCPRFY